MRVHTPRGWVDGFLPYACGEGEKRIQVAVWCTVAPVDGLYFVRERSLAVLYAYLRELRLSDVVRKVVSRQSERLRNSKYLSVGAGLAVSVTGGVGTNPVGFIASCHPQALDEIVLPSELTFDLGPAFKLEPDRKQVRWIDLQGRATPSALVALAGWNAFSGTALKVDELEPRLAAARALLESIDWGRASVVETNGGTPVRPDPAIQSGASSSLTGSLFGYGNYAKTMILPNIKSRIRVTTIHEIDPTQMPTNRGTVRWTTEPGVTNLDDGQVFLIAGFHHTHAPLASEALRRGAIAVVEKPIATARSQLQELRTQLASHPGRLFACFQRRYSSFNRLLRRDLQVDDAVPLSYHCIVYEVPLPARHWYRWPNSGSSVVSNGCHWIDHFLFLNGYARPADYSARRARDGTVVCTAELENGAVFTMVLTDRGSARIGVQDHVEVRVGTRTVRIENGSEYVAESEHRIIRRRRVDRLDAHKTMYRRIAEHIAAGEGGDSLESMDVGGQLVLDLDEEVRKRSWR
jgi:predicted dehydrogenase